MKVLLRRLLVLGLALLPLLLSAACRGECEKLADKICECRSPSRLDKENCIRSFVDSQPVEFTDDQQNECEELRKNCSCDDLREGRTDQCGLANSYPN